MKSFCNLSPKNLSAFWNKMAIVILCLFALVVITGCASTKVTNREQLVTGPIPRPNTIWIYDFAATAADVPPNSALAGEDLDTTPQTAGQIAAGMKLGDQIATELVWQINAMGMSAQQASPATKPQVNDIVIRCYLLSVQQGSTVERVAIGFGAGKSSLSTMVEGFQMTSSGLRKLGYGTVDAGGNKSPGMVLGVATFLATKNPAGLIINAGVQTYGVASGSSTVEARAKATAQEIADVLKQRFTDQGWLN
ncbi:MAG TPA: DUF4410 domain-containing protein [Verrucomicrobiae bacterium]|jgi:hypothetical protein|nr:DUF4410 domain-containing protein [Verrucomicrobiae bacterium]